MLGTPPAFILSQDQTLILKTRRVAADQLRWAGSSVVWSLKMNSLANLLKPFLLGFVLNFLKFKGPNQTFSFRIFRVLHTVQSLIFKVLCCSLSQTAHICYHKLFCLSRTFSKTFFISLLWSLSSNFYMLPHLSWSVNNFFEVFSTFLHSLYRLFPFFNGGYTITP